MTINQRFLLLWIPVMGALSFSCATTMHKKGPKTEAKQKSNSEYVKDPDNGNTKQRVDMTPKSYSLSKPNDIDWTIMKRGQQEVGSTWFDSY